MVVVASDSADLALRELILGVLHAKDRRGAGVIHSSDFHNAITDLGFSMGSSIVENVLIYCRLDGNGNLNFTELEKQLVRERKLVNSQPKPPKAHVSSSVGVATKPWRADEFHHAKLEAEKQTLRVSENNAEINSIYSALAFHEIGTGEALASLANLEIVPTNSFLKVLKKMEITDVSFSEFVRSLTTYGNDPNDLPAQQVAAGGFSRKPEDLGDQIGLRRKRATGNARDIVVHESALSTAPQRRLKKHIPPADGSGVHRPYAAHDRRIFKASAVKDILREDINVDDPVSGTIPLLSHAQYDMATGKLGKALGGGVDRVKYNIERKLQREQVLAALRKLDSGELRLEDFQDVLFSIGVDLPEALQAKLSRAVVAGSIDLRGFIKLLDASLFKAQALEDVVHTPDHLQLVTRFRERLGRGRTAGPSVLVKLVEVFKSMDGDGDGLLTFQEFSAACQSMQLTGGPKGFTGEELRLLFHAFDLMGQGTIQLPSFLHTLINHAGRTHYTPLRAQTVRQAFDMLTRTTGEAVLRVEELVDAIRPDEHPVVACSAGATSPKECIGDMLLFFDYFQAMKAARGHSHNQEGVLSAYDHGLAFETFEAYFEVVSAGVDGFDRPSDPFVEAMRACFGLSSDKSPAPPVRVVTRGVMAAQNNAGPAGKAEVAPRALQHHGDCITWRQADDGSLEVEERLAQASQGRKVYQQSLMRNFNTDVINWERREDNPATPADSQTVELRAMGCASIISVPKKNVSAAARQVLMWPTKAAVGAVPPPPPSSKPASFSLPYQEEFRTAGTPALHKPPQAQEGRRKLSGKGLEDYYQRPKPFGTDDNNNYVCKSVPGVGSPSKSAYGSASYLSNIYNMNPPPAPEQVQVPLQASAAPGSPAPRVASLRDVMHAKAQQPQSLAHFVRGGRA